VNGIGTPAPSLKLNGNQTTKGTIQLFYTVTDYAFPVGPFAQFSIDMTDVHLSGAAGTYPAPLSLKQNGSESLVLTPDQTNFIISDLGWTDSSIVQITIPAGASTVTRRRVMLGSPLKIANVCCAMSKIKNQRARPTICFAVNHLPKCDRAVDVRVQAPAGIKAGVD
jgi:hypothetical protein